MLTGSKFAFSKWFSNVKSFERPLVRWVFFPNIHWNIFLIFCHSRKKKFQKKRFTHMFYKKKNSSRAVKK